MGRSLGPIVFLCIFIIGILIFLLLKHHILYSLNIGILGLILSTNNHFLNNPMGDLVVFAFLALVTKRPQQKLKSVKSI